MIPILLIELSNDPIGLVFPQLLWGLIIAGIAYLILWRMNIFKQ